MAIKLVNTANVTDDANLELAGASAATSAVIGGTTYLFVAGSLDSGLFQGVPLSALTPGGGLSVFIIGADGSLTNVENLSDNDAMLASGIQGLTTAVVGGKTFLFAASGGDNGLSVFEVGADGSLTNVENVAHADNPTFAIDNPGRVTTAVVDGATYLFVPASDSNGLSVFAVGADGSLAHVQSLDDDDDPASLGLIGAIGGITAVVGDKTYLYVSANRDNAVSVFEVAAGGTLIHKGAVFDNDALKLTQATGITSAVVGGTTYIFVAGISDFGVSVFSAGADGSLTNVFNVTDNEALELFGVFDVKTAVVNGTTYLFAGSQIDSGVSVFVVGADGSLTNVVNLPDAGPLKLNFLSSLITAEVGGTTYLFTSALLDDGVSAFAVKDNNLDDSYVVDDLTDTADESGGAGVDTVLSSVSFSLADPLRAMGDIENLTLTGSAAIDATGNALANVLTGNDGANQIDGGLGNDVLTGGAGRDKFVFSTVLDAATNLDTVLDFSHKDDTIFLDDAIFAKLTKEGALKAKFFEIGTKAGDKNDFIVYDKKTGLLSYDADGSKKAINPVAFAQLEDHLKLKADDFFVV